MKKMKKDFFKFLIVVLLFGMFVPILTSAGIEHQNPYIFSYAVLAQGYEHGQEAEYWNLQPIGSANAFKPGERIYFMTQVRDLRFDHRYKAELYHNNKIILEHATDWMDVGAGWEYGNFYEYYDNIAKGEYVFKSYIDLGQGYIELAAKPFTVSETAGEFWYSHTVLATQYKHGIGNEYWDLKPIDPRNKFFPGETIYALAQIRDVVATHRWKAELYRNDLFLWDIVGEEQWVGEGWDYGNFFPFYQNAQAGEYFWNIYIDIGNGFKQFDHVPFTVEGPNTEFYYAGAVTAKDWHYGAVGTDGYWDIQPIDPGTVFKAGERIYLLAKIKNVYVDHRWKLETYREGRLIWDHTTDFVDVGSGFFYSNYKPFFGNPSSGNYTYKVYLDTGNGFKQIDELNFSVI